MGAFYSIPKSIIVYAILSTPAAQPAEGSDPLRDSFKYFPSESYLPPAQSAFDYVY